MRPRMGGRIYFCTLRTASEIPLSLSLLVFSTLEVKRRYLFVATNSICEIMNNKSPRKETRNFKVKLKDRSSFNL